MDKVQEIIDRLNGDNASMKELEECLNSGNILIKANAILAVMRQKIDEENIISQLSGVAQNVENESRIIGAWNGGHFALAALKLLDTDESRTIYKKITSGLPISHQEALHSLLTEMAAIENPSSLSSSVDIKACTE